MMLRSRWSHQSTLLERYLGALGSSRRVQPPAELDPGLAELAGYLHATRQRLQPPAAFVDTLRQRLEAGSDNVTQLDHRWRGPTIERRRPAPSSTPDNGEPGAEDTVMSRATDTPSDVPLQLPRRLAHEWLKVAAAVLAFMVVGTLLTLVLRDEPNDDNVAMPVSTATPTVTPLPAPTQAGVQPTPAATTEASATVSPTPAVTLPVIESTITTFPANDPWTVAVGAGAVWVANNREGTVSRIDPATNSVVATIEVARAGNNSANVGAADDSSVWVVAGILNLARIDPLTNQVVASIPIDQPVDFLAIGNGAVWLLSSDSNLLRRFDPTTNTIAASIDIARPLSATVTDDAVWIVRDAGRGTDSEILKIDPVTAAVATTVSLDGYFTYGLAVVDGSLWAPTDSALLQIDIETGQIVATYLLPQPVRGVPPMTTGDGSIWVCNCTSDPDDVLWQFDVDTRAWDAEVPAGDLAWESWLAYLDGAIWGSNQNEVVRVQLPE